MNMQPFLLLKYFTIGISNGSYSKGMEMKSNSEYFDNEMNPLPSSSVLPGASPNTKGLNILGQSIPKQATTIASTSITLPGGNPDGLASSS